MLGSAGVRKRFCEGSPTSEAGQPRRVPMIILFEMRYRRHLPQTTAFVSEVRVNITRRRRRTQQPRRLIYPSGSQQYVLSAASTPTTGAAVIMMGIPRSTHLRGASREAHSWSSVSVPTPAPRQLVATSLSCLRSDSPTPPSLVAPSCCVCGSEWTPFRGLRWLLRCGFVPRRWSATPSFTTRCPIKDCVLYNSTKAERGLLKDATRFSSGRPHFVHCEPHSDAARGPRPPTSGLRMMRLVVAPPRLITAQPCPRVAAMQHRPRTKSCSAWPTTTCSLLWTTLVCST